MSTAFGVSKECYGGRGEALAGTGQANVVSVKTCIDFSWITLRDIEKENLGVLITSPLREKIVQQLVIAFFDDNGSVSDGKQWEEKWRRY